MQMHMVLGKEQPLHPLWEQHAHHHLPLLLAVENGVLVRFLIYSLGKVFDIYWLYAECGDQYCGRILSGLDPHSSSFGTLPPHFTVGMENEYIKDAMHRCFPNIFEKCSTKTQDNMIGVLLRCLASITFHSSSIISAMKDCPGNPLLQIPILNEPRLLTNLLPLVTTKS